MAYVKCVDCDFAGNKAKSNGTRELLQKCEKRAPEANQAEEGLARYPIVELSDGGCHEGKEPKKAPARPKDEAPPKAGEASTKPAKKDSMPKIFGEGKEDGKK